MRTDRRPARPVAFAAAALLVVLHAPGVGACDDAKHKHAVEGELGYGPRDEGNVEYCEGILREDVADGQVLDVGVTSFLIAAKGADIAARNDGTYPQWAITWPEPPAPAPVRIAGMYPQDNVLYALDAQVPADTQRFAWSTRVMADKRFERLRWNELQLAATTQVDGLTVVLPTVLNAPYRPPAAGGSVYVSVYSNKELEVTRARVMPVPPREGQEALELTEGQFPRRIPLRRLEAFVLPADAFPGQVVQLAFECRRTDGGGGGVERVNLYLPASDVPGEDAP